MDPQSIPPPSTKDPNDWREYMKKSQRLQAKIDGFREVLATPLLEVFSVSIQSHLHDDGESCQIYGTIQVKDVKGTYFELYNRELTEPETIYIGGALSLTGPQDRAIFPCGVLEMKLHLMDKTRGVEVVNDVLHLNHNCREDYDEVITKYARGKHGSAGVCYSTYQSAVAAVVEVRYVNKEDTQVYGSVRACCVNGDDYPFNDFEQEYSKKKKNSSSVLFERPSNQPVRVNTRTPLVLSRSIVAVPATSCLIVEVDLSSCDTHAKSVSGTLKFLATHYGLSTKDIMDQNGHDLVRMHVLWSHSHLQLSDASSKHEEEGKNQQQHKKGKLLLSWNQPTLECPLMEVFSISIGCNHNEVMSIYGTIEVQDECGSYYIFNRARESIPENVYRYNKLACLGYNSFRGHKLYIDVNLTDPEGRIVSKGKVMWDEDNIKFPLPWYDTLLCSVIPGEQQNYARLHYTILSYGLQAKVSLCFSSNSYAKFPINIHGSLVTLYSSYDYSTYYDSEYYKRILFKTDPENPLLVSSDFEIQLSKYIVSVPIDSVLIIESNLWADMSGWITDSWCKKVQVVTDEVGRFHEVLRGKYYQIDLRVENL